MSHKSQVRSYGLGLDILANLLDDLEVALLSYTLFFISNAFISRARLKLAKAKQDPEAALLLFENYSLSSSTFLSKTKEIF